MGKNGTGAPARATRMQAAAAALYDQGLPLPEISKRLGYAPTSRAAEMRLYRMRRRLKIVAPSRRLTPARTNCAQVA